MIKCCSREWGDCPHSAVCINDDKHQLMIKMAILTGIKTALPECVMLWIRKSFCVFWKSLAHGSPVADCFLSFNNSVWHGSCYGYSVTSTHPPVSSQRACEYAAAIWKGENLVCYTHLHGLGGWDKNRLWEQCETGRNDIKLIQPAFFTSVCHPLMAPMCKLS